MGNRKLEKFRAPLEKTGRFGGPGVAEHARWGWSNYDRSVRFLMLALIALAPGLWAQESLAAEGFDHFYNLEYDQAIADSSRPSR